MSLEQFYPGWALLPLYKKQGVWPTLESSEAHLPEMHSDFPAP